MANAVQEGRQGTDFTPAAVKEVDEEVLETKEAE
jgi:hypothetical protein